ncbi:MAG TPA: formyltetrahydrofolate deformylase [Gammaproteobacteria bacterium]|nr:formyltetrahydrofolate deformylase [Gammaproteobacteria bacterium]
MDATAHLLITCPDQPGIVSAVSGFLYARHANISALDQHTADPSGGCFFMRVAFQLPNHERADGMEEAFDTEVAAPFGMDWHLHYTADRPQMAILASKPDHALLELLWRWARGELPAEISMVISNHPDHRAAVESFGLPYHHIPATPANKAAAEGEILERLAGQADLVVLARYMQILSPTFVAHFPNRIINIHHSFLPAFVGADPYQQAFDRGVKLIGATAHYVTDELDAGPVIDQDVIRVSHRDRVPDLRVRGREVERNVLARAVRWHLEDRIAVWGNRTVVFGG